MGLRHEESKDLKKTSSIKNFQTVQSNNEKGHIYAKLSVQLL